MSIRKPPRWGICYSREDQKKDILDQSHVVCSVPYEEPPDLFIGQTKQNLKVRILEHAYESSCESDLTTIQPYTINYIGIPIDLIGICIFNKSDSCINLIAPLQYTKIVT